MAVAGASSARADLALDLSAPPSKHCRVCGTDSLAFEVTIPLWMPSVSGSFSSGRIDTSGESDFGKRIRVDSSLTYAFMGRIAGRYGPYGLVLDSFGAQMAQGVGFTFAEGDTGHVDIAGALVRSAFFYRLPVLAISRSERPLLLSFTPYAGMRSYVLWADFQRSAGSAEDKRVWFDPILGGGVHLDLRNGLVIHLEGDIGGFGAGSKIAGYLSGSVEYAFIDWFALGAGWNFIRFRQEIGTGQHEFDVSLALNGPVVALSFYFP
jgi:hypothetical protein